MKRLLFTASTALLSTVCLAHHGLGGRYDQEQVAELEGEVTQILWRNPHVRLTLTSSDGESWDIEAGSPTVLLRRDITEEMVNVGDQIRVAGFASSRGRNEMIVHNILLPDGQELMLTPSQGGPRWSADALGESDFLRVGVGDASAPELGIFRVWSTTTADPGSYPLFPENANPELAGRYALTQEARSTLENFDPATDNPMEAYCQAKGMPMIMEQPFPMEFVDEGETIVLKLEEYDTVRTIHMGGTRSEVIDESRLGISTGQWDGSTLVVTTTNIDWPYFNQMGVSQSREAQIVERFAPSADGDRLNYRITVSDPETFTEPAVLEKFWVWVPDVEVVEFNCTESELNR